MTLATPSAVPPRPGAYGAAVLQLLKRDDSRSWPLHRIVDEAGVPEDRAWPTVLRLFELGLIERRSRDSVIRVALTARGRRYRL